jgi:hypothetical protein
MSSKRILELIGILFFGLGLTAIPLALASSSGATSVCSQSDKEHGEAIDKCAAVVIENSRDLEQVLLPSPSSVITGFELFAGTGTNGLVMNDPYLIDVSTNLSETALISVSISGATYDPFGERVLFTSNTGDVHESDLWEWIPGTMAPNFLGIIRTIDGDLSIDGLAMSNGLLFGVLQFNSSAGDEGLYQISLRTLANTDTIRARQVLTWTPASRDINGLDADPRNGRIYALDDTEAELIEIVLDGTIIPVADYLTAAETDLDGLAVGDDGRAYLISDDPNPGDIYVYDLDGGFNDDLLRAPWVGSDAASGGARRQI